MRGDRRLLYVTLIRKSVLQPVMTTIVKSNESQMLSEDKLQFSLWWDMIQLEKIKKKIITIEKGNWLPSEDSKVHRKEELSISSI